nr:META domain-containing protein [Acinetobacter sp. Marseille-Q1620]
MNSSINRIVPPLSQQITIGILENYTWIYTSRKTKIPILVNFKNGNMTMYSGCNFMRQEYKISAQQIIPINYLISTTMQCNDELTRQESFINSIARTPLLFKIEVIDHEKKYLHLKMPDGKNHIFQATNKMNDLTQINHIDHK